jgi:hypothetical protein
MIAPRDIPTLGCIYRDRLTGIEGPLLAYTIWHDRAPEVAIQRTGVDSDGAPWEPYWFPLFRLEKEAL